MTYQELREAGERALKAATDILKEYNESGDGKNIPQDKSDQVDKYLAEAKSIDAQIQQLQSVEDLAKRFAQTVTRPAPVGEMGELKEADKGAMHKKLFRAGLSGKTAHLSNMEIKGLVEFTDPEGGYVAPEEMRSELITKLNNALNVRSRATVISTNAQQVSFPTFDYSDTSDYTAEAGTVSEEDITNAFGKQIFTPFKNTKLVKVSRELLDDSSFDLESFLAMQYAFKFDATDETNYLGGNGVNKPLGLGKATLTSKDIASGAAYTVEDIIGLPYELKAQYRANGTWVLGRSYIQAINKLRSNVYTGSALSATGDLLLRPSLIVGQPATLAGYPVIETEYMPTASADGDCIGLFGDLKYYWIVERKSLSVMRINELYAASGQVGLLMDKRVDAAPVLSEAILRINRN